MSRQLHLPRCSSERARATLQHPKGRRAANKVKCHLSHAIRLSSSTTTKQKEQQIMLQSIQAYVIPSSVKRVMPVVNTRLRDIFSSFRLHSGATSKVEHDVTSRTSRRAAISTASETKVTNRAIHSMPSSQAIPSTQVVLPSPQTAWGAHTCRQTLHFDSEYKEEVLLNDGTRATLRLVQPSDHDLWIDGFSRLSDQSRYNRFCAAKKRLTEKEIRYFTNVDHENHVAILAVSYNEDGKEIGLGVARFIRSKDDPRRAEPAITVTDDAQSRGLGTLLSRRLAMAAKERGIEYFDSSVLGSNTKVIHLIKEVAPTSMFRRFGPDTVVSTKLFDDDDEPKLMSAA